MSKILLAATAAALLAGLAGQAAAREAAPAQTVSAARTDFNNSVAVQALYADLGRAAVSVCDTNSANPRFTQDDRACAARVLADAVRQLNRPTLTAMHETATGRQSQLASARP